MGEEERTKSLSKRVSKKSQGNGLEKLSKDDTASFRQGFPNKSVVSLKRDSSTFLINLFTSTSYFFIKVKPHVGALQK